MTDLSNAEEYKAYRLEVKNRLNIPFQVCKMMYKFWMLLHELRKLPSYLLSSQFLSLPLFFLHHLFSPTLHSTGLAPVVKTLDSTIHLAPVVQTSDSAIHRINHYPADSVIDFRNTYPLDSDLSGG